MGSASGKSRLGSGSRQVPLRIDPQVAGVDEAGRGPLAGPVVVAAVMLDPAHVPAGLDDSKKLTARRREALFDEILGHARAHAICIVPASEIDRMNILQATLWGMREALGQLHPRPARAFIDGNHVPREACCPVQYLVGGDALEPAISAASILAKVTRDRIMLELDARHPGYGFAQHKGYPTPEHLAALQALGPCNEHRRSYAPVRLAMSAMTITIPEQGSLLPG